jgi:hypothetical protein
MNLTHCILVCLGLLTIGRVASSESPTAMPVGISGHIDVILTGGELEPVPQEDKLAPVVLRMESVAATETGFHYRIAYSGLEPGDHDLRRYLRWKDLQNKAPIPDRSDWHVSVQSHLQAGQIMPHELTPNSNVKLGGYRQLLWILGGVWVGVLLLILLLWRRRKRLHLVDPMKPVTLADRLRPLIERGVRGELTESERAELERVLIAYWRTRLGLERTDPLQAIRDLQQHPDAGPLLVTLQDWLHRPPGTGRQVNMEELLRPYREIPADGTFPQSQIDVRTVRL